MAKAKNDKKATKNTNKKPNKAKYTIPRFLNVIIYIKKKL